MYRICLLLLFAGWCLTLGAVTPESVTAAMQKHFGNPDGVAVRNGGGDLFALEIRYKKMLGYCRVFNMVFAKPSADLRMRLVRGSEPAPLAEQARRVDAVAGINAGAFYADPEQGWLERGMIRIDGQTLPAGAVFNTTGGGYLVVDEAGKASLVTEAEFQPDRAFSAIRVLPLLLYKGEAVPFQEDYVLQRIPRPRSVIAFLPDGWVMLMVINGQQAYHAYGMAAKDVRQMLQVLGCTDGALLDCGKRSTLYWGAGDSRGEVLNYPPGNFRFDHDGAQDVSSVLVLTRP